VDFILNRTLVYAALTAGLVGLYVLVVSGMGLVLQTNTNMAAALLTSALVMMLFKPLHTWLQRSVNRIVPAGRTYPNTSASAMEKHPYRPLKRQKKFQGMVRENKSEDSVIHLPARMWPFLRNMWFLVLAVFLGIIILNVPSQINMIGETMQGELMAAAPSWLVAAVNIAPILAQSAVPLISLGLAVVLYVKRPKDGIALFLSYFLLVNGVVAAPLSFLEPFFPDANAIPYSVIQPLIFAPLLVAFLSTFPNGRFVPSWTRWLIVAAILYAPVSPVLLTTQAYSRPTLIYITGILTWFMLIFTGLYAQIYRYRHVSNPIERQQTKWVIYGFALTALFASLTTIRILINRSQPQDPPLQWWSPLINLGWVLAHATLPVSLTFAVMRYRLFHIDLIINRTLVYGALTAGVAGVYALVVGGMGVLFQTQGNLIIALLATGLIAVLFQPFRDHLQRGVNRLIYGERDDPVEALSRLGQSLETALPPDQVLPALVKTIAQTLKLPFVGIAIQGQPVASFGQQSENPSTFPLTFQGETTGELLAAPRSPDEFFTPAETRLLRNLARQAGAAVRNAQLTADLQRSRQNLVTAREEERHRLRRDLHDGIGPTMAGLTLKLDAAKDLIAASLETGETAHLEEAVQFLTELKAQTQETVQDVRRIVHALRPPSLDVLGLAPALQAHFGQIAAPANLKIQMTTIPQEFPRLSAAVEVAAYRIALEAVTNVIHHAQASVCRVSLAIENGYLQVEVADNGVGISKDHSFGVGLNSMRERAEELGGRFELNSSPNGTYICAQIPVP